MVSYVRGRTRRLLSDDEIVSRYLAGDDSATVALAAGCDSTTVLDLVRAAGGEVRKRGTRPPKILPLTEAEIVRLYKVEGLSGPVIGDRCHTTAATIYAILRRHKVRLRPPSASLPDATAARRKREKS